MYDWYKALLCVSIYLTAEKGEKLKEKHELLSGEK